MKRFWRLRRSCAKSSRSWMPEPEDMMSKAYERWGERHEALEDELDDLLDLLDGQRMLSEAEAP